MQANRLVSRWAVIVEAVFREENKCSQEERHMQGGRLTMWAAIMRAVTMAELLPPTSVAIATALQEK